MDATPDASPGATAEQTPAEDEVRDEPAAAVSQVAAFVEKPDAETARAYCDRGWYWNAGIFAWSPSALLEAARDGPLAPLVEHLADGEPVAGFDAVEPISIDYAVMEEATNAFVVPAAIEWDDLGSWDAVGRILPTDDAGNASLGETLALDAADNVVATDGHVSVVGVSGLIVATFGNRTVVLPRGKGERVREIATTLTESSTADTEPKQS